MSTDPTTTTHPAPGPRGTNWLGIIALVLVCAIVGSAGGALAGGAAGYLLGRQAARSQVARAQNTGPQAPRSVQPQPVVPPQGRDFQWPELDRLPSALVYAEVASVVEGSPAEQAGVQAGDYITAVDGGNLTVRRDLAEAISTFKIGDQVELTVERGGQETRIKVTLGENPDSAGRPYLGLTYRMITGIGSRYPSS